MSACDGDGHTLDIVEALAVFQPAMFWLNADAELNICTPHRSMTQHVQNQHHMRRSMPAEPRHAAAASTQRLEARTAAEGDEPACPHAMDTGILATSSKPSPCSTC